MISGTLQIVFAICLVIILFIIGFATYNYEFMKAIQQSSNSVLQKSVPIFDGIKDIKNTETETYTVADKKQASYRDILPSFNQAGGGLEFSYSFWLYNDVPEDMRRPFNIIPDNGYKSNDEIVLFLKGSTEQFTYNNLCDIPKTDFKTKCPLVKLEHHRTQLTVEFNTLSDYPDAIKQGARDVCSDVSTDWVKMNSHKLSIGNLDNPEFNKKWVLVTIVIKDTVPTDSLPYRNKAHCSIYLNNFMELDTYVDGKLKDKKEISTVKTNKGNLYVFPDITGSAVTNINGEKNLMIANLTYFNHAIDQKTIEGIYSAGVPRYTAASVANNADYSNVLEVSGMYNESLTLTPRELSARKLPSSS